MRQRELEILLERVPDPTSPDADREQVPTPAPIAAWLLYTAHGYGDVRDRSVADLGCGTGILAVGAAALQARRVVGIDIDPDLLEQARSTADELDVAVDWVRGKVGSWTTSVDTVLMNPPFGARSPGADRPFLDAAVRSADAVYSFHLAETEDFVRSYVADRGGEVVETWEVAFPVPHQHHYQREAERTVDVVAVRIRAGGGQP